MKKINALALSSLWALPLVGLAQVINPPKGITEFGGFIAVFNTFISWMFTILMILAVIFILLAAFHYLTAGGDQEKVGKAHKEIIWAVVAIAVGFLAQGISFVVGELLRSGNAGT